MRVTLWRVYLFHFAPQVANALAYLPHAGQKESQIVPQFAFEESSFF